MFKGTRLVAVLVSTGIVVSAAFATGDASALPTCDGQWQLVPSGDHSQQSGEIDGLNGVTALSSGDQWAVGSWEKYPEAYSFHTLVEHWDGSSGGWSVVPSPNSLALNNYLNGVAAVGSNDAWAVGGTDSGSSYRTLVEHWDGTSWSIVSAASFPGVLHAVAALGPDNVWAVGNENYPGRGLIEHWNGASWTATYLRFPAQLRGIAAVGPKAIWAVGQRYNRTNSFGDTTLAMFFNGSSWRQITTPNPLSRSDTDQNWLTAVSIVAAKDIWAVGRYGNHDLGPNDETLIEHWNGSRWSVVPSPSPGGSLDDDLWGVAAVGPGDVWAVGGVGSFLNPEGSSPLALHWDGSSWTQAAVAAPAVGELLGAGAEPAGAGISAAGDTVRPATPNPYIGTLAEHLCPA
jgi:hypothetical protein